MGHTAVTSIDKNADHGHGESWSSLPKHVYPQESGGDHGPSCNDNHGSPGNCRPSTRTKTYCVQVPITTHPMGSLRDEWNVRHASNKDAENAHKQSQYHLQKQTCEASLKEFPNVEGHGANLAETIKHNTRYKAIVTMGTTSRENRTAQVKIPGREL